MKRRPTAMIASSHETDSIWRAVSLIGACLSALGHPVTFSLSRALGDTICDVIIAGVTNKDNGGSSRACICS